MGENTYVARKKKKTEEEEIKPHSIYVIFSYISLGSHKNTLLWLKCLITFHLLHKNFIFCIENVTINVNNAHKEFVTII